MQSVESNILTFSVTAGQPPECEQSNDDSCPQLEVLRGRDGRDGRDGERGEKAFQERGERKERHSGVRGPLGPVGEKGQPGGNYVNLAYYSGQPPCVNSDMYAHNVPCTVCMAVSRCSLLMIPGKTSCPVSWTTEYVNSLMSVPCPYSSNNV